MKDARRTLYENRRLIEVYGQRIKDFAWSKDNTDVQWGPNSCDYIDEAANRVKELTQELRSLSRAK